MTNEEKKQLDALFIRYGAPSTDKEIYIRHTIYRPDTIYEKDRLEQHIKWTTQEIKEIEIALYNMRLYLSSLCDRYNEIETTYKKHGVKLVRRVDHWKKDKVFYTLSEIEIFPDGHIISIKDTTYTGKERKEALKAFETIAAQHPEYVTIKDIETRKR